MTILNEGPRVGEALITEADNFRSRDEITIIASQTLLPNQVIGRAVTTATVGAAAAVAGNTGNGTIALAGTPFIGMTQMGTYQVLMRSATRFDVIDPQGATVGYGVAGTAFSNQIAFTLTAGGTAFVANDAFTIAVTARTVRWGAYDPAATDGRAMPAGVLRDGVTTGVGQTAKATAWVRAAAFNSKKLQWLTGLTSNQISAAIELMNASNAALTVRTL